jgi:hypothetical protein
MNQLVKNIKKECKRILLDNAGRVEPWLESELDYIVTEARTKKDVIGFFEDYYESSLSYLDFDPELAAELFEEVAA